MKKILLFFMAMMAFVGVNAQEVTLDFTSAATDWGMNSTANKGEASYTNGTYTVSFGVSPDGHKANNGYVMFGKNGATMTLPAFDFDVEKIVVEGSSQASASTLLNLYVGETAVSTETTGCKETNTYEVDADYQAAGTVYTLKVNSKHNAQVSKIHVYKKVATGEVVVARPEASVAAGVYEAAQSVELTAEEGATIKYSVNGGEAQEYTAAITVSETATIEAWAEKEGVESKHVTLDYVIVVDVNVATALQMIADGKGQEAYVTGYIISINEISTQYGNATYVIADAANATEGLTVYRGYSLNGDKFTAEDEIAVGDKVKVYGKLILYTKDDTTTPEVAQGNKIVSIKKAQLIDKYVVNADFSSLEGWTVNKTQDYTNVEIGLIGTLAVNNVASVADETHTADMYCLGLSARWQPNYAALEQTTTALPAGEYLLTFDVANPGNSSNYNMANLTYVQVGDTKFYDEGMTAAKLVGATGWVKHSITFTVAEEGPVTISFGYRNDENAGSGATPELFIANLQLADALVGIKALLAEEIATAEALLAGYDAAADYAVALAEAIATAKGATVTSSATGQAAIDALKAAENAAKEAKAAADLAWKIENLYAKIEAGSYYIKNNESGLFLQNGAFWGTRAVLGTEGLTYGISQGADGKYTLVSGVKGANKALRPSDGFNDQSGAWELVATDGGFYMFNGAEYFCYDGTGVPQFKAEADASCVWSVCTAEERMAALTAAMATASAENPVDASFFIKKADFMMNDPRAAAWNGGEKIGGDGGSGCAIATSGNSEKWNAGVFDVNQTLTGLPAGTYKLTARAYYRGQGTSAASADEYENGRENTPVLYAGEKQVNLVSVFAEAKSEATSGWDVKVTSATGTDYFIPNSQGGADICFQTAYLNTLEGIEVGEDGTLRIGIKAEEGCTAEWVVFDQFHLIYLGAPAPAAEPLYTVTDAQTYEDEETAWATPLMVEGDLTVEAYEDYVIVKNFAGIEGYDLKVDFDEEEYATAINVLHDGVEADATTGWVTVGDNKFYAYLNGYSYASSDADTQSGYVYVTALLNSDSNYVTYYVAWGEEEEEAEPLYSVTGAVAPHYMELMGDESDFPEVENVMVDVYENYAYIHAWAGVEGYDLKVYTNEEGTAANKVVPVVNGVEGEAITWYGELSTGLAEQETVSVVVSFKEDEEDADWFISGLKLTKEAGFISFFFDSGFNGYYLSWNETGEEEPAKLLYTAEGEISEYEWASMFGSETMFTEPARDLQVDVYDKCVIVHAWAGTEGYDMKLTVDAEGKVTKAATIINGEETSEDDGTYAKVYANDTDFFQLYLDYCKVAYDADPEEGGYMLLFGYSKTNSYDYLMLTWPQEDAPFTLIGKVEEKPNEAFDWMLEGLDVISMAEPNNNVKVDVTPAENTFIIRDFMNAEGVDLQCWYQVDEEEGTMVYKYQIVGQAFEEDEIPGNIMGSAIKVNNEWYDLTMGMCSFDEPGFLCIVGSKLSDLDNYYHYSLTWGQAGEEGEKPVVTPAEGEYDELQIFTFNFGQAVTIAEDDWENWIWAPQPVIGNDNYSESLPLIAGEQEGVVIFELDKAIVRPGEYTLTLPKGCVTFADGTPNSEFVYHYTVTGNNYNCTTEEGETTMAITPAEGTTVSSLKNFTVTLTGYINANQDWEAACGLYDEEGNEVTGADFGEEYDEETWEPTGNYSITLDKKVTKAGTYTLKFTVNNLNEEWLQIGSHAYEVTYIVDGADYVELPTTVTAITAKMPAEDTWDNSESFVETGQTMNVEIGEDYFIVKNLFGIEGYDLRGDLMWGFVGSISLPGVEEPSMMIEVTPNEEIGTIGLFVSEFDLDPKNGYLYIQVMGADESSSYIYISWDPAVVTGINSINRDNADKAIFNLNGVRLTKPVKGINIINGKKVLVK